MHDNNRQVRFGCEKNIPVKRRTAAPCHTLKGQEKCFSTPLRNAFYLITILLTIKNNLVK